MHNRIILVVGPKGSGKTHKVVEVVSTYDRYATFDLVHESAYAEAEVIVGNPRALYECVRKDVFKVTYRPVTHDVQANGLVTTPEFEPFVKLCYLRGDMLMVIDEAHLLCNSRNCPRMLMVSNLIGRHRELSMILVAQSFSGIHPAIRKNADEFYFWKIIEPSDLEGIQHRCGREVMEQVRNLRAIETDEQDNFKAAGQMLHWTKSKGVVEVTE